MYIEQHRDTDSNVNTEERPSSIREKSKSLTLILNYFNKTIAVYSTLSFNEEVRGDVEEGVMRGNIKRS